MPIQFVAVSFENKNNIEINLTIEAPIGKRFARQPVPANKSVKVPIGLNDCASVALIAEDSSHSATQTFKVAPPDPHMGAPSYLERVDVQYVIGTFSGGFAARTG
jgi:hypothetical protein